MALKINHAILHIPGHNGSENCLSKEELDIESETCSDFITKHVKRLLNNPASRTACFLPDSKMYALVKSFQEEEIYFRDLSVKICEMLSHILNSSQDIPAGDLLITAFENNNSSYLAILKLKYIECFTHRIKVDDSGSENQIIKNTTALPFSSGKVEEACLIPFSPMVLRILEKSYKVNGEDQFYFSKLFLECDTELSKKETAEIIHQIADEINLKYFDNDIEMAAKVKYALIEESLDQGAVCMENVAKKVFHGKEEAKQEFMQLAKDSGLPYEMELGEPFVRQQFKTQKFKADNGVEIICPSELFSDPESVQLVVNGDGSISITLKNLRKTI